MKVYSFKYDNFKQTLHSLTINFYGFIITTSLLFGFKVHLLVENIKNPSLHYLFLTVPISLLIIYFYTKDLAPILKELKEINKSHDKNMEENGVNK